MSSPRKRVEVNLYSCDVALLGKMVLCGLVHVLLGMCVINKADVYVLGLRFSTNHQLFLTYPKL